MKQAAYLLCLLDDLSEGLVVLGKLIVSFHADIEEVDDLLVELFFSLSLSRAPRRVSILDSLEAPVLRVLSVVEIDVAIQRIIVGKRKGTRGKMIRIA